MPRRTNKSKTFNYNAGIDRDFEADLVYFDSNFLANISNYFVVIFPAAVLLCYGLMRYFWINPEMRTASIVLSFIDALVLVLYGRLLVGGFFNFITSEFDGIYYVVAEDCVLAVDTTTNTVSLIELDDITCVTFEEGYAVFESNSDSIKVPYVDGKSIEEIQKSIYNS